ncbi:arylsulfatase A-like [Corticium candelabrum]|uniref:arylsulfatase A-like n=1 Tax=Corticium candelabrum TaxID=121492 RepID=UPI002E25E416|nr:arylsulfatase A-like [Corticium candelabrum]
MCLLVFFTLKITESVEIPSKPNVVLIYGDDVGYGDLNVYGHPTSWTPNLDRMAREGLRMLQFYSAAPICSPSRASLMTGRLYPRTGVYRSPSSTNPTGLDVFSPGDGGGMLLSEITVAQVLKEHGYATGMVGKWHLGIGEQGEYLPHSRGFDSYFGLPFTQSACLSDINPVPPSPDHPGYCFLYRNSTIVSQPADIRDLDAVYVQEAKEFISNHQHEPFFFYFASHHTHRPQWASSRYQDTTRRGIFGDALAELDWSVGEILSHLESLSLDSQTLVVFMSDNGPELKDIETGGEQGPLKCGKGTTYEGGVREPAIFWWPGIIPSHSISESISSTLDLFTTIVSLTGATLPNDRATDGIDLTQLLTNDTTAIVRDRFFYYSGVYLMAVRYHHYKVHFWTMGSHCFPPYPDQDCWDTTTLSRKDPPLLFNLDHDPKERHSLNLTEYHSTMETILKITAEHNRSMTLGVPMIGKLYNNAKFFPCCSPSCKPRPLCCSCSNDIF